MQESSVVYFLEAEQQPLFVDDSFYAPSLIPRL
jgi:hypothetical protein